MFYKLCSNTNENFCRQFKTSSSEGSSIGGLTINDQASTSYVIDMVRLWTGTANQGVRYLCDNARQNLPNIWVAAGCQHQLAARATTQSLGGRLYIYALAEFATSLAYSVVKVNAMNIF
jgi:hypothetical protein